MTDLVYAPLNGVRTEEIPTPEDPTAPKVGRWYWVKHSKTEEPRWLGCVVHVGSNYVRLKGVRFSRRVHIDAFFGWCVFEPNPDSVIGSYVATHQHRTFELMEKVREVTARLGVGVNPALTTGSETHALTLRRSEPMDEYKTALVKAKNETLPALFNEIKGEHAALARWMKARLIPLKAQAGSLTPAIKSVEDCIFSVQCATWGDEADWHEADTRYWYRKFYTETRTGQLMALRPDEPQLFFYEETGPDVMGAIEVLNQSLVTIRLLLWALVIVSVINLVVHWR